MIQGVTMRRYRAAYSFVRWAHCCSAGWAQGTGAGPYGSWDVGPSATPNGKGVLAAGARAWREFNLDAINGLSRLVGPRGGRCRAQHPRQQTRLDERAGRLEQVQHFDQRLVDDPIVGGLEQHPV